MHQQYVQIERLFVGLPGQALDLVSDVHVLADRVRIKVTGTKTPERGGSLISPRPSGTMTSPNRMDDHAVRVCVLE